MDGFAVFRVHPLPVLESITCKFPFIISNTAVVVFLCISLVLLNYKHPCAIGQYDRHEYGSHLSCIYNVMSEQSKYVVMWRPT